MKTAQTFSRGRSALFAGLSALCWLSFASQSAVLAATPSKQEPNAAQEIIALYSKGNDARAMTLVDNALAKSPRSANLHYLRANIFVAEDRLGPAIAEYQEALKLNPDPALERYCTMELNVLTQVRGVQPRASATIAAQANHQQQILQQQAMNDAQRIASETTAYQQRHETKTSQVTAHMQNAGSYDKDGDWVPAFSPDDIANMQAARALREQQRVAIYARSSADLQNAAREKAAAAVDSAEGLQSVLQAPVQAGESALNPNNSNLYIRNYTLTNSSPATPGAKGSFNIGAGSN